jgi:hypothetical protein
MTGFAIRRLQLFFFPDAGKPAGSSLGMRKELRQFAFGNRSVAQSQLYGDVVKPARSEATVEVPQAWHDHPGDRGFDVRPGLVKDEKIQPRFSRDLYARINMLTRVFERAKI